MKAFTLNNSKTIKKRFAQLILAIVGIIMTSCTNEKNNDIIFYSQLENTNVPKLFMPGNVSKRGVVHFGSSFSKHGKHLVYTITSKGKPGRVVYQTFKGDMFSEPELVINDTIHSYADASISLDGKTITLTSNRPTNINKTTSNYSNLWQFKHTGDDWGTPKLLTLEMDYKGGFGYPTMTKDKTLYFAYLPDDGSRNMDIFTSKFKNKAYEKPVKLPPHINSEKFEGDPFIDSHERFLIFAGFEREKTYGKSDLYISFKLKNGWSKAINLGKPINSHGFDGSPYVTSDDKYLIFTSSRHPEEKDKEEYFNVFYVSFDLEKYKKQLNDN